MPDAPTPTYDSHGNLVAEWSCRIRYDSQEDRLEVHWQQERGPYHKAKHQTNHYEVQDVEDAIADMQRIVRTLGARRLF